MKRSDIDYSMHGDQGFFAQLPAVLLAGAAIAAILVVNQPQPVADHPAASKSAPVELLVPAGGSQPATEAVASSTSRV